MWSLCPLLCSQRDYLMTLWRPTAFFLGAVVNVDGVMDAIRRLNRGPLGAGSGASEVVKPQCFVETGCLNTADLSEFARWLVGTETLLTYREVNTKLADLAKRWMLR